MNLTLHLTEACNLRCSYCTHTQTSARMDEAILDAACRMAFPQGGYAGISFFGGEPLLEKKLILRGLRQCREMSADTGIPFQCKMTTNGTLLDEDFLKEAVSAGMEIGLSFDGSCQDMCRCFPNGAGTQSLLETKTKLLLDFLPNSYGMMTIAPQTVKGYAAAVRYLHELGFRRITATIAYGNKVRWDDEKLALLDGEMKAIADYYYECYMHGDTFFFSPFDSKIRGAIKGENAGRQCHLGTKQIGVAVDGQLYPCTQFLGDAAFCLGDVFTGILPERRARIAAVETEPTLCKSCGLRSRCIHSCGCMNRLETGQVDMVSPLNCTYERMVIAHADALGDRLYAANPVQFESHFAR